MQRIEIKDITDGNFYNIDIDDLPAICPYCKVGVDFKIVYGAENSKGIYIIVECPHCKSMSLLFTTDSSDDSIVNLIPSPPQFKIKDNIQELSPNFYNIYKQAYYAKEYNLTELIGFGFGKAVEQLVYDYIIKVQNETPKNKFADNIKMLKNFEDATISLTLARFIRNDEVHLEKKNNFSVNELIEAVEYILVFFEAKYATYKYKQKLRLNETNNTVVSNRTQVS